MYEVGSTHRFTPVGECIYCGSREGLTDEHIIPLALNGNMVLPKSSCQDCNRMTSRFERRVLRGLMLDARLAADFKSRRRKDRPEDIRVRLVEPEGHIRETDVPRLEAPGLLMLPTFAKPAFLTREHPVDGIKIEGYQLMNVGSQQDLTEFARRNAAIGVQAHSVPDIEALGQMLAKIAYSFAVAVTGVIGRDSSPLPDLMRDPSNNGRWIGSDLFVLESERPEGTHGLAHIPYVPSPNGAAEVVLIKLFTSARPVEGYVVVTRTADWRAYSS